MIIPLVSTFVDDNSGDSFLLLQDMSATHMVPVTRDQQVHWNALPDDEVLFAIVQTLGEFHAAWWESDQLGIYPIETDDIFLDERSFRLAVQTYRDQWQSCRSAEQSWLPPDMVEELDEIVELLPAIWERYLATRSLTSRGLTVVHGDAYLANFLVAEAM